MVTFEIVQSSKTGVARSAYERLLARMGQGMTLEIVHPGETQPTLIALKLHPSATTWASFVLIRALIFVEW